MPLSLCESDLKPLTKFSFMLKRYTYDNSRYSMRNGKLECINNKIKVIKHKAYCFFDLKYFILLVKFATF